MENLNESFQYCIEVQEGLESDDGKVIIIYNYDGVDLTPELLAKTLEELSTQTSLQRTGAMTELSAQASLQRTGDLTEATVPSLDEIQLDPVMLTSPVIKVEESVEPSHVTAAPDTARTNSSAGEMPQLTLLKAEDLRHEAAESVVFHQSNVDLTSGSKDGAAESVVFHQSNVDLTSGSKDGAAWLDEPDRWQAKDLPCSNREKVLKLEAKCEPADSEEDEDKQEHCCDSCAFVCQGEIELQRHKKREHRVKDPFVCRHCGKSFQHELSLVVHKLGHKTKMTSLLTKVSQTFSCPLCQFEYQKKGQVTAHMRTAHSSKNFVLCSRCSYACLNQAQLSAHMASAAHEGRTLCPLCGTSTKDIRQHIRRTHNENRPYLCTQCGFKAKTWTHLNTHMVIHEPVKRVICELCQYRCHTKDQLKKHLVKHSSQKDFKCALCQFACKTKMSLKRHMQIHEAPNKYVCYICQFSTHDKLILRQHKSQEHVLKASYKCRECLLEFGRVVELKKHALAEHKSEWTHFCSYCDFVGQTLTELRTHMQSHFGKFSFSCDVCGYMCRLKASYQRHMERHKKVKRFSCTLCAYASVEKYDLQKHYVHRHSEEKPLACPYCAYRCKFQPRLNNHISYVHSDVKPFFCKICSYTGKSAENLKKHMANHGVLIKSLHCVLCDYATAEKAKLKRHMQVHVKKAVFQFQEPLAA
ncbi:oocyte zinc finger protein XlCOF6-like [Physella acuta]|uniref:oocyte zinc finger protein XlCOF6-like n=1 Tax=Physella acuta TaxID=109671 RepID=UPI0027DC749D|nr:oocyte zinc finger protein XlCOF6-like [Physella acuta]